MSLADLNRRAFPTAVSGSLLAAPLAARAQQPAKVPRIGLLGTGGPASTAPHLEAFWQGLRDNLKTDAALSLTVPQSLLLRADEVIR